MRRVARIRLGHGAHPPRLPFSINSESRSISSGWMEFADTGSWMLHTMVDYTTDLFNSIPDLIR